MAVPPDYSPDREVPLHAEPIKTTVEKVTGTFTFDLNEEDTKTLQHMLEGATSGATIYVPNGSEVTVTAAPPLDDEHDLLLSEMLQRVTQVKNDILIDKLVAELTRYYAKAKSRGVCDDVLEAIRDLSLMVESFRQE